MGVNTSAHKVQRFDLGFIPSDYVFVPSRKAWDKEMKRICMAVPYPTTPAACVTVYLNPPVAYVAIQDEVDDRDAVYAFGTIAHEATHVAQAIMSGIGEDTPSDEFQAYAIQRITEDLLKAYKKTRKPKCLTKWN